MDKMRAGVESPRVAKSLALGWQQLCARYLPVAPKGSLWRYSRDSKAEDPDQGWKLHISATILTAGQALQAVGPFLQLRGIQFKAATSLEELGRLNSGLYYGYSQVGKFITVYPRSNAEAKFLARKLHNLTRELRGPAAPFDQQFQRDSCIYYRYGSFTAREVEQGNGVRALALRDPQGNLIPDQREVLKPDWVPDLFHAIPEQAMEGNPLANNYHVFKALVQRGKGGVYKALDLSNRKPRFSVIKEGRLHGETDWSGRDGRWRINNEKKALEGLWQAGVEVPRVYDSFELDQNFYVVTEFVEGETLQAFLNRQRRRLTSAQVLSYAMRLAELQSRIHSAGWIWRDCKPTNLIVTKYGSLRPLDFEGACTLGEPDSEPWGTPGYVPPEWVNNKAVRSAETQDLYALGATIYLLLTGILPSTKNPMPIKRLRRNVYSVLLEITDCLLHPDPLKRPSATSVSKMLNTASR